MFTRISVLTFQIFLLLSPLSAQQNILSVVASSPHGVIASLDQSQTILATFSDPMVALQAVPTDQGTGPMIIEPNVRGKYRWMGTITSTFIPENPLPYSTSFTVRIPAGTSSLKGTTLPQEFSWSFETPRPKITWTSPGAGQEHVDTITAVILRFNQPVNAQTAAKYISIEVTKSGGVKTYPAFTARKATENDSLGQPEQLVILNTARPFGMGASVSVTVKEGLRGIEGPLPMNSPYTLYFSTYGELKFLGIDGSRQIFPQSGIMLVFSNEVTSKDVMKNLSFVPPLTTREEYYENTYPSTKIYIPLPLQPESTYAVKLKAGLTDKYGNVLAKDENFSFYVQPYQPFVRTKTGIGVLEGYESHKFPVTTMNMDSFRVQMGKVNPDRIVPLMEKLSWDDYEKMAIEEGVLLTPSSAPEEIKEFTRAKVIPTRAKRNTVTVRPLDLDDVIGRDGRGVVFVQVDDMNPGGTAYLKTLVQVTNFGITAKFSPESNLIWVTNLKDASPVPDANVELRNDSNAVVWSGTTDEKGLVKTPGWGKLSFSARTHFYGGEDEEDFEETSHPRQWVIVTKDDDIAYTTSEWSEGIQPDRFDLRYDWNPQPEKHEGMLFTDRGLYKANETVEIKGIVRVRTESSWKIYPSLKTRLVVKNSRNEEVFSEEQKLSPFGSFAASVALKPNAPLGYYSMLLEYALKSNGKEEWKRMEEGTFRVEAFRAAEFEVIAKMEKEQYIIGDTINGFLNAKYLYGAPMKNEKIRWRLSASRGYFAPPGFEGYFFGKMGWLTRYQQDFSGKEIQNQDTVLDAFGSMAIHSPIRVGEFGGTISLMLEGEVTSASRQTLAGHTSTLVHGGEYYIGIKPSSTFVKSDSEMTLSVIAATPQGKLLPDQTLNIKLYQRVWHSVRKAETGGRFAWYSTPADTLIDTSTIVTGTDPYVKKFTPKEPGFFFLDVEGNDSRGNALASQTYFYASGSAYVPWERTNDDRIELIANKTNFQPGETASIIVKNPYEKAIALVTIEREGILKHFTTMVVGSAPQIDIPVTSEFLPNVFVSVVLLQGRTDRPAAREEADIGRPSFKIGYVALSVDPKEKKLNVSVESFQKEYRPGDTVDVIMRVRGADGSPKRAEVTLSVADLGILNLIGYRLPDPFDKFYRERELAVVTTETRIHIIEQRNYDEKGQEVGGGGAAVKVESDIPDAEGIRKDFRPSAYWNPSIMTDENGTAVVRFKLPDNLTAFEMMAVAHTKESEAGYAENSFAVNKPLLLQPSLPRFVRVGDSFKSGVVIMNYSNNEEKVKLVTSVTGLKWDSTNTTEHVLKPGQAKEVLFNFTAEKIGSAKFVFRAYSEHNYDGLQWTIPINAPRLRESVALYESLTDPSIDEHIVPPADAFGDIGDVQFTAASTAMVGLSGGISYLFHYPYGCLEQRSSAILPMILAKDLVDAFKFDVLKDQDYRSVVMKTLDEVPLFQRSNGGFSYWKNEGRSWSYVSAFAMFTLVEAKKNGYQVDEEVFNKGLEYLKRVLNGEERDEFYEVYYSRCTRALILYTLSLAGKPEYGFMETLYNERQDMPLFAKAYLLRALHAANGNKSMQEELVRDLSNMVKIAPTSAHFEERSDYELWWCFDSNIRTTALIMQALIETQPQSPIIPKAVRWLIDQQKLGHWRTTQENVYVVDALATYLRAYEKDEPNFRATVTMEGRTLLNEFFQGRSFKVAQASIPFTELALGKNHPVTLTKDGAGRLYYGIRMNYYPKGETQQKEEGFSVIKSVEPLNGTVTDTLVPGTLMKVTITVASNQARHFVVVDDPVPAGWEIVNTSFQTIAAGLVEEEGEHSDEWYERAFHHVEKYDDHVLLFADYFTPGTHSYTYLVQVTRSGSYQMPATRAEGMYEPEVFGQTASKIVVVQ
ncbi:MAG: alpha-2-macroglobulin family protein [Bacteroidota bacterium]